MSDKMKRDGAMRLFEALSSADEELLERSEGKKKVFSFWKYSKVMAACVCLVVLGTATYATTRVVNESGSSADCAAPMENMQMPKEADAAAEDDVVADGVAADEDWAAVEEAEAENRMEESSEFIKEIVSAENAEEELYDYSMQGTDGVIMDWGPIENAPERLDEKALRAEEIFGDYLPTELPTGYIFTDGNRFSDEGATTGISVTWSKGLDYITVDVREYTAEDSYRVADISKPETYNVHLYEIPYASSVPDEMWMIFNNPIFRESDFDLEIIEARMKRVEDAGDTDTPRGHFTVLYDSGVLVSFSGKGSVEEIWNLFQSIKAE
uniref:hypothetical protein n=1 Tax=Acetatifactor sp. TaxID=1872090 RepID=UPI00405656EA